MPAYAGQVYTAYSMMMGGCTHSVSTQVTGFPTCRERNDGLYRPITYVIFKMMEEISITLINSLVFSSIVFFPLKLTGDFILFWLLNLTTTSIGIGELH